MTTTLDDRTLTALNRLATPDEVAHLCRLLDDMSHGRYIPPYAAIYIADILHRLASSAPDRTTGEVLT